MKPHYLLTTILSIVSGALLSGCSFFQWAMPASTLSDSNVLAMLNTINLSEIDAATLARQKTYSEDSRIFANRMLDDHTRMLQETQQLAQRTDIVPQSPALASTAAKTHQATMEKLRTLSGREFDRAYLKYQIKMHEQAIDLLGDTTRSVDNTQLHAYLQYTRANLNEHLFEARARERQLVAQY
jgi:putative membrane protein